MRRIRFALSRLRFESSHYDYTQSQEVDAQKKAPPDRRSWVILQRWHLQSKLAIIFCFVRILNYCVIITVDIVIPFATLYYARLPVDLRVPFTRFVMIPGALIPMTKARPISQFAWHRAIIVGLIATQGFARRCQETGCPPRPTLLANLHKTERPRSSWLRALRL